VRGGIMASDPDGQGSGRGTAGSGIRLH